MINYWNIKQEQLKQKRINELKKTIFGLITTAILLFIWYLLTITILCM
jgi:hypothetical protein